MNYVKRLKRPKNMSFLAAGCIPGLLFYKVAQKIAPSFEEVGMIAIIVSGILSIWSMNSLVWDKVPILRTQLILHIVLILLELFLVGNTYWGWMHL